LDEAQSRSTIIKRENSFQKHFWGDQIRGYAMELQTSSEEIIPSKHIEKTLSFHPHMNSRWDLIFKHPLI
jgi:hypothetical protein